MSWLERQLKSYLRKTVRKAAKSATKQLTNTVFDEKPSQQRFTWLKPWPQQWQRKLEEAEREERDVFPVVIDAAQAGETIYLQAWALTVEADLGDCTKELLASGVLDSPSTLRSAYAAVKKESLLLRTVDAACARSRWDLICLLHDTTDETFVLKLVDAHDELIGITTLSQQVRQDCDRVLETAKVETSEPHALADSTETPHASNSWIFGLGIVVFSLFIILIAFLDGGFDGEGRNSERDVSTSAEPAAEPAATLNPRIQEAKARCESGERDHCIRLSGLAFVQIPQDADFLVLEQECENGAPVACSQVGHGMLLGFAEGDPRGFLDRGCKGGEEDACRTLAIRSETYDEYTRKRSRGFRKACRAGSAHACFQLADILSEDPTTPKKLRQARRLFNRACERNEANACWRLGLMYRDGQGGTVSVEKGTKRLLRALDLFQRDCNAGNEAACAIMKLASDPD